MSQHSIDGSHQQSLLQVRKAVMAQTQLLQNLIPPTVSYTTQGNVLIIGPEDLARLAAEQLPSAVNCVILANDPVTSQDETYLERVLSAAEKVPIYYSKLLSIKGFLGQFQVLVAGASADSDAIPLSQAAVRKPHFDMILDLSQVACLQLEMLPPGYFYAGREEAKLTQALTEIPELIGEFDKPRYVKVNTEVCAHYRHGMTGCSRCLNFCPADAIASVANQIEVDPYLCHGAGSCASVCPTGALAYELPTSQSLQRYLHQLISRYVQSTDGVAPVLMLHEGELDVSRLPAEVLPIALEEISVAGIDHWFSALAWGAKQLVILTSETTAPSLLNMLDAEISLANEILEQIGQPKRLCLVRDVEQGLVDTLTQAKDWPSLVAMDYQHASKRSMLFNAIDHLNQQSQQVQSQLVKANIPYGNIVIQQEACTLCLSCVASCPTQALKDGRDEPALRFVEQDCIQCGLCEQACPEKIISLQPRINFNQSERQTQRTLKEEQPFECIVCGTPFTTQSMVEKMLEMVGSHDAFSANIERLKMCGDCRVKDLFEDILQDPEKQLR